MANSYREVLIFSTGTELTTGKTKDGNAPYIASNLSDLGFNISEIHILPDNESKLLNNLKHTLDRFKNCLLIITGGLGPTLDDHTINVLAELTGEKITTDETSLRKINILIKKRKIQANIDVIKRQSRTLLNSTVLKNNKGLAPGLILDYEDNTIVALPGVPDEMKLMFDKELLPMIQPKSCHSYSNYYYIYNTSETAFQNTFLNTANLEIKSCIQNNTWGVTSENGKIKVFISTKTNAHLEIINDHLINSFKDILIEKDALQNLHDIALQKQISVGLAESCTGGLVGKLITDLSGSSDYFKGSLVTYSNQSKHNILEVSKLILEEYGAVSEECAIEMAQGVIKQLDVDYSLSLTGIAGPTGGTKEKPVGTIYLVCCSKKGNLVSKKLFLPLNRDRIRNHTAHIALFYLQNFIKNQID